MSPREGQTKPSIRKAVELLESGEARSFSHAARLVEDTSVAGIARAWRLRHGKEEPPARYEPIEVNEDDEPTVHERELGRKVVAANERAAVTSSELRATRRELEDANAKVEELEKTLELMLDVKDIPTPTWVIEADEVAGVHQGTLLALFSDFHVGERVEPSEMAWYNAFDEDICRMRIERYFQKCCTIPEEYLNGVEYDGIVLASLGDTISGDIHDEFRETNELSNYEAVPFVVPLLKAGIELLKQQYGKVHVVSVPGNHPRDSRKPRYKKRSAHNADTMIWKLIAADFADDFAVSFDIPDGLSADFQIYDTRFRAEHGDEAKGGTGIQGALAPLALRTHRVRKQADAEGYPFDIMLFGHWHQLMSLPAKGFIVNGSGKGYDEWARGKAFDPEQPQQLLGLVTPEYGLSAQWPLFVADREAEGW